MQQTFRALADPTRRNILELLRQEPRSIAEIASRFAITRAAIKKHLIILQQGDLVRMERRGREQISHFNPAGLVLAQNWLTTFDQYWDERLNALQHAVSQSEEIEDDQLTK